MQTAALRSLYQRKQPNTRQPATPGRPQIAFRESRLIDLQPWPTRAKARRAVVGYIAWLPAAFTSQEGSIRDMLWFVQTFDGGHNDRNRTVARQAHLFDGRADFERYLAFRRRALPSRLRADRRFRGPATERYQVCRHEASGLRPCRLGATFSARGSGWAPSTDQPVLRFWSGGCNGLFWLVVPGG